MIVLTGDLVRLSMREDGTGVAVEDLARGVRWELDEASRLATREAPRFACEAWRAGAASSVRPLGAGTARLEGPDTIRAVHDGPGGRVSLRWILDRDRVRLLAEPDTGLDAATGLTLPGTFRPVGAAGVRAAIPLGQGVLHTGAGPAFFRPLTISGHGDGFTLSVFGALAARGALAVIAETATDVALHWEKTDAGRVDLA